MAKRELPPRCNRGKNNFYNTQLEVLKQEKTRTSLIKSKKRKQTILNQEIDKKLKQSTQIKRQTYNENKKNYKFTRGIHYFYDLSKLQRVPQSISYAIFSWKKEKKISKNKNYSITYSNDNMLIGNTKISQLINRNFIGLPKHEQNIGQITNQYFYNQKTINQVIQLKRNDKNQCHHYLFQIQDKKHNLDRMIKQLQFILKKITYYLKQTNIQKLKSFSIVQKDNQLSQVFFQSKSQYSNDQKISILKEKIQALYQKKQKLNITYQQISLTYYHNSLDQQLFNQIKHQKQHLNRFSIYHEMQKNMKQHQKVSDFNSIQNSTIMNNYLNFHQQSSLQANSQLDQYYCIDDKEFDPFIIEKALKIISIRLFHEGQNCFYFGKKVFFRILDKQLTLQKEIKPSTLDQYSIKLKQIQENLSRYWKKNSVKAANCKQKLKSNSKSTQKLLKKQSSKSSISLRVNQKVIPIDFYQYHCIKLFQAIHDSLLVIKQFILKNQNKKTNIIQVLASLFYPKLQNRLLTIVQVPKFGLLTQALDKLVDVITHVKKQFQPMNYHLFIQYNQKNKQITTFVKQMDQQSDNSINEESQLSLLRNRSSFQKSCSQSEIILIEKPRKMVKCGQQ